MGHFEGSFVASPNVKETNDKVDGGPAVMFFSNEQREALRCSDMPSPATEQLN